MAKMGLVYEIVVNLMADQLALYNCISEGNTLSYL